MKVKTYQNDPITTTPTHDDNNVIHDDNNVIALNWHNS